MTVIEMPYKPNYSNDYVQIKLKPETHKLLRETAEEEYGSEAVPWSIVIESALRQFSADDANPQIKYEV